MLAIHGLIVDQVVCVMRLGEWLKTRPDPAMVGWCPECRQQWAPKQG